MSKKTDKSNSIVLSYRDSLLRETDVQLLQGPHWINDAVIGFYFEYLGEKMDEQSEGLLFVSPELTQLLKLTDPSDYGMLLEPIRAKSRSFVFFPLNNCDDKESPGGTHWSLLVYSKLERICFHFDSSKGMNSQVARNFATSIADYFGIKRLGSYLEVDTPQQSNGYDCGLYVLCTTELVAIHAASKSQVKGCDFLGLEALVNGKRKHLIELINYLRNDES
ncbi:sentrin-specific protease 8 [Neodiprion fabricii]|uniref:sentrin-specific protease 8 n=1 Tax=Neodiprion fabricii TaxID=2872261 RepID=UPI001ED91256|nr:sentrin-specific protease 8 [Neodiprion fabricii]